MVGTGVSAAHGILIKGGAQLQKASEIHTILFDKTGTLANGRPVISDVQMVGTDVDVGVGADTDNQSGGTAEHSEADILWRLGCLERNSEHPLAEAVVNYAKQHCPDRAWVDPTDFVATTRQGVTGQIAGVRISLGNRTFLKAQNVPITAATETALVDLERQGKTAVIAELDGTAVAALGISDEIKPDAAAALRYLQQKLHVEVWIVTGDNRRTATAVAKQLDISMDYVIAEALPAGKLQKVKELQNEGKVVAMIGDGINDSPALAQADLGISVGRGADIAAEAADIVLMKGNVSDVCVAIDVSKVIFRQKRLNLFWSMVYNCCGIPVAAGVFYAQTEVRLRPEVAAIAMAFSSISVVLSSLALKLYRPPEVVKKTPKQQTV
mmetsp:Transcript_40400/g.48429  ORF Transcript_40400/g.48429 Transcript_40400/m.48429 type:complete len:382 (-) Transcript_40400:68-1213(-)